MCDSLEFYVSVENVASPELQTKPFPYLISRKINQDGEVVSSKPVMTNAVSPLTNSGFKVKSVFSNKKVQPDELGYSGRS